MWQGWDLGEGSSPRELARGRVSGFQGGPSPRGMVQGWGHLVTSGVQAQGQKQSLRSVGWLTYSVFLPLFPASSCLFALKLISTCQPSPVFSLVGGRGRASGVDASELPTEDQRSFMQLQPRGPPGTPCSLSLGWLSPPPVLLGVSRGH